jgi:TRAP-type C4-dicarboxylate transport system permease small subunit
MNPYYKGAVMLLRLVALGLMTVGGLNTWLEFMRERLGKGDMSLGRCAVYGLLGVAGLVLLFGSGAMARRLTRDFDE